MTTSNLNTLLEGPSRMKYYTELRLVFEAINGRQCGFNWLLTDVVAWCAGHFDDFGPYWLTGVELTRIVKEHGGLFDWGVLSGFPPTVTLEPERLEVEPYADGNPGFWVARPQVQHPLAEIEIVCWDTSATLLLCRERCRPLADDFRRYFPEAVDLDSYNQQALARHRA